MNSEIHVRRGRRELPHSAESSGAWGPCCSTSEKHCETAKWNPVKQFGSYSFDWLKLYKHCIALAVFANKSKNERRHRFTSKKVYLSKKVKVQDKYGWMYPTNPAQGIGSRYNVLQCRLIHRHTSSRMQWVRLVRQQGRGLAHVRCLTPGIHHICWNISWNNFTSLNTG